MVFPCHWLTLHHFLDHLLALFPHLLQQAPPLNPYGLTSMTSMELPHPLAEGAVKSQGLLGAAQGTKLGGSLDHPDMAYFLLTRGP